MASADLSPADTSSADAPPPSNAAMDIDPVDTSVIRLGTKLIVSTTRGAMTGVEVTQRGKVRIGNAHVNAKTFIGARFGDTFQLQNKALVPIDPALAKADDEDFDAPLAVTSDNRHLVDDGTAQTLTEDDVRQMKAEGRQGTEIIEQLTKSSQTFGSKTEFAQKKYISRKKKRHLVIVTLLRPSLVNVARMMHLNKPRKICEMRPDALAMMLSLGNVQAHAKAVVCEQAQGLLLAGVVDRLGGFGQVLNVFPDQEPHAEAFRHMDYSDAEKATVAHFPLSELPHIFDERRYPTGLGGDQEQADGVLTAPTAAVTVATGTAAVVRTGADESNTAALPRGVDDVPLAKRARVDPGPDAPTAATTTTAPAASTVLPSQSQPQAQAQNSEGSQSQPGASASTPVSASASAATQAQAAVLSARKARGQARAQERVRVAALLRTQADCLLIAAPFMAAKPLLQRVWPLLGPGRPVAMYHTAPGPLAECALWLRGTGMAMRVDVAETWLREYQVLPGRTHPMMNRHGTSGYVLTATKLAK